MSLKEEKRARDTSGSEWTRMNALLRSSKVKRLGEDRDRKIVQEAAIGDRKTKRMGIQEV